MAHHGTKGQCFVSALNTNWLGSSQAPGALFCVEGFNTSTWPMAALGFGGVTKGTGCVQRQKTCLVLHKAAVSEAEKGKQGLVHEHTGILPGDSSSRGR